MSHPNPQHESENSYPSDNYKPVRKEFKGESPISKLKGLIGESQEIRKGNLSGKKKSVAKKMKNQSINKGDKIGGIDFGTGIRNFYDAADKVSRLAKHRAFVKKNPHKHSPYVKYEEFND